MGVKSQTDGGCYKYKSTSAAMIGKVEREILHNRWAKPPRAIIKNAEPDLGVGYLQAAHTRPCARFDGHQQLRHGDNLLNWPAPDLCLGVGGDQRLGGR